MALIHGRYDGFNGFARDAFWGFTDASDTDAEKSWNLLSTFYPEGTLGDPTYCHNCPTDKPLGFYASTPIGNIDAIPVENSKEIAGNYKALAFMGYNCADDSDFAYLHSYVENGGKLLLTLAHTTSTTRYEDILAGKLEYKENVFAFTTGAPELKDKTVNGVSVPVAANLRAGYETLLTTDDGAPLVVKYSLGKGEITLFTASAYPAHTAIEPAYRNALASLMNEASADEHVWAEATQGTQFSVYDRGEETDVYFLAADWYRAPENMRTATLRIGKNNHVVTFPFGTMIKASVWQGYGAYPHTESAEVISVKDGVAKLQGTGKVNFTFLCDEKSYNKTVDFTSSPVVEITI